MKDNSILLITGGTGSFGNAVLRRFLDNDRIREIRIFSRDEKKQDDMRRTYQNDKLKYFIGDVRNKRTIDSVMYDVDLVFHAAALKQVPSCEFFPGEAIRTNVIGCENVIESAIQHKVTRLVLLSTDKAVYPINAMGMTKALSEKVMVAKSRNLNNSDSTLCATRYGNVMASRGSVIPLFIEQIKSGQPVTVTDPNMTRYMMTLDDAINLVLFAMENGRNGDIFIQKSPACTVDTLARALLELYKASNPIKIIGTRHGEKLYETLVNREEMIRVKDLDQYYCIPADTRDLNYGKFFSEGESAISDIDEYNSHNTQRLGLEETRELLLKLPEIQNDLSAIP